MRDVEVGAIYTGRVTRLLNFGAMVEILPSKEGLVHISELADHDVNRVEDVVQVGDEVTVKVIEIDRQGRVNLSRRAVFGGFSQSSGARRDSRPPVRGRAPGGHSRSPAPRRPPERGYRQRPYNRSTQSR